ncbi:KxYKxGKxW signal peptide containing protein, partial [Fructobacillus durionis]
MDTKHTRKEHFKMYKAGKHWLYAAITAFAVTGATAMTADIEDTIGHGWHFGGTHRVSADSNTDATVAKYKPAYFTADGKRTYDKSKAYDGFTFNSIEDAIVGDYKTTPQVSAYTGVTIEVRNAYVRYNTNTQRLEVFLVLKKSTVVAVQNIGYDLVGGWGHRAKKESPNSSSFKNDQFVVNKDKLVSDSSFYVTNGGTRQYLNDLYSSFTSFGSYAISTSYVASYQSSGNSATNGSRTTKEQNYTSKKQLADRLAKITIDKTDIQNEFNNLLEKYLKEVEECSDKSSVNSTENSFKSSFNEISSKITALEQKEAAQKLITTAKSDVTSDGNAYYENLKKILDVSGLSEAEKVSISAAYYQAVEDQANGITGSTSEEVTQSAEAAKQTLKDKYQDAISDAYQQAINAAEKRALNSLSDSEKEKKTSEFDGIVSGKVAAFDKTASVNDVITAITSTNLDNLFKNTEAKADFQKIVERIKEDIKNDPELTSANKIANGKAVQDAANSYSDNLTNNVTSAYAQFKAMQDAEKKLRELAAANRQTLSDAQKDVKKSLDAIYAKAVDEINKDDSLAVVNGTHIDYSARDKQLAVIKELWQRAYGEVDQAKTLDEAYAVISNDGESLKNMHSEKKAAREKLKAKAEKGLSDLEEILKRDRSGKRYVDQTRAKAQAAINADLEKAYNEIDDATFEKISEKISDTSEQLTKDIDAALNKKRYAGNYDATRKNWWNQFVAVRDQAIADLNKRKQDIAQSPYNGNTNLTIGEIDRQIASIMDISQEVWNEIFAKRMPKRTNVKAYDREVKRKGKQAKTYFAVMDKKTVVNGTLKEQMDRVRDISGKKTSARQKVAEAAQAAIKDIENQSATMTSDEMQTVIDGLNKTYDEQVMIIDRMNDAADIDAAGDAASKKITDQKDKDKKAAAKSMADRQSEYAAKIQAAVDAAKSAINHSALSTAEKALQQESVQKAGDAAIDKVKAAHTKVDDLVKDFNEGMATVQGLTNEQNKSRQTLADKAQTAIDKINGESRLKESEKQALIKKVNDALSTYQQAADRTTTIKDAQDAASNADFETLLKDVTNFSNIPNDKQPVVSTDAIAAIKDAVAKAKAQVEADSSLSDDSKRNQKKAIDAAASAAMTNIENAGNDAATVKTAVSNGVDNISKLHDSKNQLHVDAEKAAADARNAVEKEATFSDADKAERKQLIDNALRDYLAVVDGVSDAGSVTAQSASAHGKYVLELAKAQTPGTTFDAIRGEALSKLEAAYNANKPGTSASQAAKDAYETLYSDSKAIINNSKNAQEVKDNLPGALDQLKNINADKDSANASFKERAQKALDDLAASDAPSDQSKQLKETLEKALDAAVDNVDKQTSREGVANAKDNADLDAAIKNSYVHDSLAKIRQDAIDQINDLADYEQSLIDDGIPNPDSEEIVTKESTFSADEKAKQKAYIEEKRNAALEKLNDSSLTTKGEIDKVVEETSQLIDGITEAKQELLDAMTAEHGKAVDAINGNKNLTIAEKKAAIEKLDAAFKAAEAKVSDETDFSKLEGIDTDIEDKDENVLYTTTDYSENPHFKEMKGLLDAVTGAEHASLDNQKNTAAEALRQYAKDEFEKAATEAKLSEAEKVNAKTALDKFVESVISSNIDVVTEAEDIAGALAQSKTAVDNYLDLKKDAYKTIEQAAQDAKNLLNNLAGDASDTNSAKGKAYAEIDKLAENADKTIDDGEGKADDVQSNTQKGVDEIKKAAAGLLVQAAADKANDYIDQLKLNDEDKAQAKENIKNDL